MLVLKGIFGGSLKITSENKIKITFKAKNSLKRFLGLVFQLRRKQRIRTRFGQPPQPHSEPLGTMLGQRDSPWRGL